MSVSVDILRAVLGAAQDSHREECAAILADLEAAGCRVEFRRGQLAYSPSRGAAGGIILDPEASIAAWRHEYQHFLDDRDNGYPGLSYYFTNPAEYARLEQRGYEQELQLARELGRSDLETLIVGQMHQRIRELSGDKP